MSMTPLFKRHPRRHRRHLFDDLPYEAQREASSRYLRSCQKWGRDLPSWRRAILIGQARRWTMTSQEERSQWGRSMLAKRGGYAVQQRYRREGRTGDQHPAHKAAKKSVECRKKKRILEQQLLQALPASPQTRRRLLPIWS
jgi:hypothetical protein